VRRADRGGKGPEGEGRLDHGADKRHLPGLPHGRPSTTRHDMIVACLCLRVSGKLNAELEVKTHSHLSDQNQKPDIWLVDRCKAVDVGVIQPRQMDAYYNEKVKKYRDGTLPIIYGTDGSLHPKSKRHLEELHVDLCPGCLRHRLHGCKGERAPDEADQARPGRKPGHPERPSPVILLLTTE
ncbi:Reverse transcriptase/endonuclease, partial [Giardia duodenalis]